MNITATMVKELREKTGVGMMECKNALTEANGVFETAVDNLRKKGLATAKKKASRTASQGLIFSYIHMDKLGVLIELNCETDFVARTDDFKELCLDIALHIAAANPQYLDVEDVPADLIEREKEIYKDQMKNKPANIVEKILEGKMEKFYSDNVLLRQIFVKDQDQKTTITDLITTKIAKLGENIVLRRFVRFQLGEKLGDE